MYEEVVLVMWLTWHWMYRRSAVERITTIHLFVGVENEGNTNNLVLVMDPQAIDDELELVLPRRDVLLHLPESLRGVERHVLRLPRVEGARHAHRLRRLVRPSELHRLAHLWPQKVISCRMRFISWRSFHHTRARLIVPQIIKPAY